MIDDNWTPPREWRPGINETVVDDRSDTRGRRGTVTNVEVGGPHFGDRDYWIDVRWDDGSTGRRIASHWLYRKDGTQ